MKNPSWKSTSSWDFFHIESFIKLHHQDAEWQAS